MHHNLVINFIQTVDKVMSALKHINDFQTPTDVAKYMVNMLPAGVFDVLEPTPGLGRIKKELELMDYDVTDPEDYFLQDITISQCNFTTKDDVNLTISACTFYKINNIIDFYTAYSEPNTIIANTMKSKLNDYLFSINYEDLNLAKVKESVFNMLKQTTNKGFEFMDFKVITFSKAKTYRIIKDNLYSQKQNQLDEQLF